VWLLNKPMKRHQRKAMEKGAEVEAHMVETIGAIHAIKAFRAEDSIERRTKASFDGMQDEIFKAQMLAGHATTISSLMSGLTALSLLWFGGREVIAATLSIGQLMALYTLLGMMLGPIERLASAYQPIQDAIIAAERLSEFLEIEPESAKQRP